MNLYLRYFNSETVVHSLQEAVDFLNTIDDIKIDDHTINDIQDFMNSDARYPKRYKVRAHVYFIVIKTNANTLEEFKANKTVVPATATLDGTASAEQMTIDNNVAGNTEASIFMSPKEMREREHRELLSRLNEVNEGWYEAAITFKRVVTNRATGKHDYCDTDFSAYLKASSGKDCYDRLIEYVRNRVDSRSQFPSIKGRNYKFRFIGKAK